MKKTLITSLFLLGYLAAQAQHEYTIEGHVKGMKDGSIISLWLRDGQVGSRIASDTVRNETFRFKKNVKKNNGIDELSISCHSPEYPPMSLTIFAAPDAQIKVSGTNNLIYTWKVDSQIKEQLENNQFIEASRSLWDEFQLLTIKMSSMRSASETERKALESTQDILSTLISEQEIALMQKIPISTIWMNKLWLLSTRVKYDPKFPYKKETLALYNKLSKEQKSSTAGQEIIVNIFPPTVVKEGDDLADADLYDLSGKIHHLSDFKGKHLLLDFWSSGCGPCIMALPEMKELQKQYKDRLTIVSLSTDTKSRWTTASAEHEMTWLNLSDLKQTAGLYAKYGVRGIPNYVLISPQGKVIKMWSGFGKGSLKVKMSRYLDTPKREMTVSQQEKIKTVHYPTEKSSNTDVIEVKQVELTDTATIIHINAYYIPKYWIQMSPKTVLMTDNGTSYSLKGAEGITPGEHFFLPESGKAEFKLIFEPLPSHTKSFDFREGDTEGFWQIKGIGLTK